MLGDKVLFDAREEVLEVRETERGLVIVSTQETLAARQKQLLGIHADVMLLPDLALGAKKTGLINVSVAPLRKEARHASEQVSQLLMGHEVTLLEKAHADWYRVRGWDGYIGFLHREHVLPANPCWNTGYQTLAKFAVSANYAQAFADPDPTSEPVFDVSSGSLLAVGDIKAEGGVMYRSVFTPDMRKGYLASTDLLPNPPDVFLPEDMLVWIKQWIGTPYLWGGNSPRGFDCSGLIQLAAWLGKKTLPRDASQQVEHGSEIFDLNWELLIPGDLLFFGDVPGKITHVAVYEKDGYYLHASGRVRRNSLKPESPDFDAYRFQTWQTTRRLS